MNRGCPAWANWLRFANLSQRKKRHLPNRPHRFQVSETRQTVGTFNGDSPARIVSRSK